MKLRDGNGGIIIILAQSIVPIQMSFEIRRRQVKVMVVGRLNGVRVWESSANGQCALKSASTPQSTLVWLAGHEIIFRDSACGTCFGATPVEAIKHLGKKCVP